jgi:hypothetical protein
MVSGLPVAAAVDEQVEAAVERELLEQVVVETGAGGDAYASGAVEAEPHAQGRLRRRTNVPDAASLRLLAAGERGEQQVVVLTVAHGDADASTG